MEYSAFPANHLKEEKVLEEVAVVATLMYRSFHVTPASAVVDIFLVDERGAKLSHILNIPKGYEWFVMSLLWRRFALAVLLQHGRDHAIRPRKFWVTLAQNFIHLNNLWRQCCDGADDARRIDIPTITSTLDRYIVTEALVGRHEPVYVSDYRRQRSAGMPNISVASAKDIGM